MGILPARVAGSITFQASDCPPGTLGPLKRDLSFDNPEYIKRIRFGRYAANVPRKVCMFTRHDDGTIEIPRGAIGLLRETMAKKGAGVQFDDQRLECPATNLAAAVDLRDYQYRAISRMAGGVQGYIVAPCGAGKTVTGIAAIAACGQPTLVIVHTRALLDQWVDQVRSILGIEPGIVGGGKNTAGDVTIATVQTIARMDRKLFGIFRDCFGCVIVDEAHHTPATTFRDVIGKFPAKYRFGLTATPTREDGLTPLMRMTLGERLFEIDYAELVALGYLQEPEIKLIPTGFQYPYAGDHAECMEALIGDADRNQLIADLACLDATKGEAVLVLSDRVEHCERLADLIDAGGVDTACLTGGVPKKTRTSILNDFRSGRLPVVVASTLADEGLDVPRLSRIILAYPGKSLARTTQRLGRLMRIFPGKGTPVLYDLVDDDVPPLHRQSLRRQKAYRELAGVSA